MFKSKTGKKPLFGSFKGGPSRFGAGKKKKLKGGPAQTQVMAKKSPAVIQQTPKPQKQQQKQHQHQQAAAVKFTQEELQRDLETLARQQNESKRRLEDAKKLKQRRVERHANLESLLGEIKYQVGQERAELQRRHNLLSEAGRILGDARLAGGKGGDDLREIDRKLKMVIGTKRTLTAHQRKQDRLLDLLTNDSKRTAQLIQDAHGRVEDVKAVILSLQEQEQVLRSSTQHEKKKGASIAEETAKHRGDSMVLEQDLDSTAKRDVAMRTKIEAACSRQGAKKQSHAERIADITAKTKAEILKKQKLRETFKTAHDEAVGAKATLHKVWNEVTKLNAASGLKAILGPDETAIPPSVDLDPFLAKADTETKASQDEIQATSALESMVKSLKTSVDKMQHEVLESKKKVGAAQESLGTDEKVEKERSGALVQSGEEFVALESECVSLQEAYTARCNDRAGEVAALADEVNKLQREEEITSNDLSKLGSRSSDAKQRTDDTQAATEANARAASKEKQDLMDCMTVNRSACESIEAEIEKLSGRATSADSDDSSVAQFDLAIGAVIDEHPDLEDIPFSYDPEKTLDDQTDESLAQLLSDCKARIKSAAKMKAELVQAKQQQEEERRKIEEAADSELRRKKAREKRKHRLNPNDTTLPAPKPDKTNKTKRGADGTDPTSSKENEENEPAGTRSTRAKSAVAKRSDRKSHRGDNKSTDTGAPKETRMVLEFESAAKPRLLLKSFSQPDESEDNSNCPTKQSISPPHTIITNSDKKVTWGAEPVSILKVKSGLRRLPTSTTQGSDETESTRTDENRGTKSRSRNASEKNTRRPSSEGGAAKEKKKPSSSAGVSRRPADGQPGRTSQSTTREGTSKAHSTKSNDKPSRSSKPAQLSQERKSSKSTSNHNLVPDQHPRTSSKEGRTLKSHASVSRRSASNETVAITKKRRSSGRPVDESIKQRSSNKDVDQSTKQRDSTKEAGFSKQRPSSSEAQVSKKRKSKSEEGQLSKIHRSSIQDIELSSKHRSSSGDADHSKKHRSSSKDRLSTKNTEIKEKRRSKSSTTEKEGSATVSSKRLKNGRQLSTVKKMSRGAASSSTGHTGTGTAIKKRSAPSKPSLPAERPAKARRRAKPKLSIGKKSRIESLADNDFSFAL